MGDGRIAPRAPEYKPAPGTAAFGQRAAVRREGIITRGRRADLRVKTARTRASAHRSQVDKILEGD